MSWATLCNCWVYMLLMKPAPTVPRISRMHFPVELPSWMYLDFIHRANHGGITSSGAARMCNPTTIVCRNRVDAFSIPFKTALNPICTISKRILSIWLLSSILLQLRVEASSFHSDEDLEIALRDHHHNFCFVSVVVRAAYQRGRVSLVVDLLI